MQVIEEKIVERLVRKNTFVKLDGTEQELLNVISDLWKLDHTDDAEHIFEDDKLIPDREHMQISRIEFTFHYKYEDGHVRSHQISAMIDSDYSLTDE